MLELKGASYAYPGSAALRFPDLQVAADEHCLLLGPSGSGKTTLFHLAAGLLSPQEGQVRVGGVELAALPPSVRDRERGKRIGIVFQRLHLVRSLTVLQNLLAAQYCAGLRTDAANARAALAPLGLAAKADAYPAELSQGQMQRAAIARAVVNGPQLLLADEPTSSLDDANAEAVLALLKDTAQRCRAALLVATHDARAQAAIARRVQLQAPA